MNSVLKKSIEKETYQKKCFLFTEPMTCPIHALLVKIVDFKGTGSDMARRPQAEGGWDEADQWLTKKLREQIKCHQKMNSMPHKY